MAPPYQTDFDENSISGSIDVKLTNLANSEVLAWNATNFKWENSTSGAGGNQNLLQVLTQGNNGGSLNVVDPGTIGNSGTSVLKVYTTKCDIYNGRRWGFFERSEEKRTLPNIVYIMLMRNLN